MWIPRRAGIAIATLTPKTIQERIRLAAFTLRLRR